MKKFKLELNINDLTKILKKHLKDKSVYLDSVRVAEFQDQRNPKEYDLGFGSVLTIKMARS